MLQVALIGALSVFPLAFVLTLLMYVKVGSPSHTKRWHKIGADGDVSAIPKCPHAVQVNKATMHPVMIFVDYTLAALFSIVTVASTAAAIRYIVSNRPPFLQHSYD